MTSVKQRLEAFISHKGLRKNAFEVSIGASNGYINSISKGIGADKLNNIRSTYPDLNINWLIYGDGNMLLYSLENSNRVLSKIITTICPLNKLSEKMGENDISRLQEILDGKRNFEPWEIDKLVELYPDLNKEWLESGEGEMYIEEEKPVIQKGGKTKFFPNAIVTMGNVTCIDNPNEEFEYITIPNYEHCQYAVRADGNSMLPMFNDGDILLFNDWNENYIEWGRVYLVITRGGNRVVKRLYPSKEQGFVVCRSENPDYPDFEIELDGSKFYAVKGAVSVKRI